MSDRPSRYRLSWVGFGVLLWLATIPTVSAVQPHEQPEGFIVHQLAHLAFLIAMGYAIWRLARNGQLSARGWQDTAIGVGLFGVWNALTLTNHYLVFTREMDWVSDTSMTLRRTVDVSTMAEWAVYIGQMDFVVAVAGIAMLYRGFRRLRLTGEATGVETK